MFNLNCPRGHTRRDGTPVRILCTDDLGTYIPVAVQNSDGTESLVVYRRNGKMNNTNEDSLSDLIDVPAPGYDLWANIYSNGYDLWCSEFFYDTREEARKEAGSHSIACIRLQFREGDGLT